MGAYSSLISRLLLSRNVCTVWQHIGLLRMVIVTGISCVSVAVIFLWRCYLVLQQFNPQTAVQPIDLNIAFTLNDEQSRRATTALTAKHLLATTVATAGTNNPIPCQLYSHRLSPDRLCHTQTNHRESEYSNIKAMIWTGLTMPAVQLTYPDIASIEPSNYSLHHPNRNSAPHQPFVNLDAWISNTTK